MDRLSPKAPKRAKRAETAPRPLSRAAPAQALRDWALRTPNLQAVLKDAGVGRSTFYALVEEQRPVPCWVVAALVRTTDDLRLLSEALELGGGGVVPLTFEQLAAADLREAAMRVTVEDGRLSALAAESLEDGVIDRREAKAISNQVDQLHRRAEAVRAATKPK